MRPSFLVARAVSLLPRIRCPGEFLVGMIERKRPDEGDFGGSFIKIKIVSLSIFENVISLKVCLTNRARDEKGRMMGNGDYHGVFNE